MKWFFDTSALIPVFLETHPHHEASFTAFLVADKSHGCCAAHSLAEVYSTLTRLPGRHRLSGEQVLLFLEAIKERLKVISLDADEYYSAIQDAASLGIVGGMLYDALLVHCARKATAEVIYTWNVDHFRRLGADIATRIQRPKA